MDLEQLESLLKSAKTAQDLFGADPDKTYRDWALLCHPDRFVSSTEEVRERAKSVFTLLEARREELKKPPIIWKSKEVEYHLGPQLGKGEISTVYLATQKKDDPHFSSQTVILKVAHVKEANEYLEKEAKVLADMRAQAGDRKYSEYLAKPIELFTHDELRVAVQKHYEGFYSLTDIMEKHPAGLDGRHVAWMFKRLLTVLGFANASNYVHCAIFPMHVLYQVANHGCKLISWASCMRSEQKLTFVPLAYKSWYPKQEITTKYPATASLDIFLAAKTMLALVKLDKSNKTPPQLVRFLESCLADNPLQRPQNAWKLLDEWDQLLKKVYGPPKFVSLYM